MTARSLLLSCALGVLVCCRQNDDPSGAEDLLAEVQDEDYRSWQRAPGYEERTPSNAPHSDNVEIFVNDILASALQEQGLDEWPVGSLVAKDGYDDDGELELVSLMQKREDGWYFAEYDGEGTPLYSGRPDICTNCHADGDDFVRAFSLP